MSATRLKRLRGGCGRHLLVVKRCGDGAAVVGRGKKWRWWCIEGFLLLLVMTGWWIFRRGKWWGIARRGGMILPSFFLFFYFFLCSFVFCLVFYLIFREMVGEVGGGWMVLEIVLSSSFSGGFTPRRGGIFLSRNALWDPGSCINVVPV